MYGNQLQNSIMEQCASLYYFLICCFKFYKHIRNTANQRHQELARYSPVWYRLNVGVVNVIIVGHAHIAKNSKEWLIKSILMETEKQPLLAKEFHGESPRGIKGLWRHDFFPCIPARYVLAIMGFLGFVNVYALRVNLSMAIVPMVNNSASVSSNIVS